MEKQLADFCDIEWERMLDATCLEVVLEANAIVSAPAETVEAFTGLFRLPRALIKEATAFARDNAEACLRSRHDVPSMPLVDPWDARSRASVEERICLVLTRLARLAEHHWGLSGRATRVSQYVAKGELLRELAASWEEGQRAYHRALQAGDGAPPRSASDCPGAGDNSTGKQRRGRRGQTTEERLKELIASDGGWERIFAARTAVGVGKLVRRSHASVVGTRAWKEKIYPQLCAGKSMAKYHRLEREERRRDRHQTD